MKNGGAGGGAGAEGARTFRRRREVQFGSGAALRAQVAARVGSVTIMALF